MATSTGPNLENGRKAVEKLMDDTCDVYLPASPHVGTMDPETLQLNNSSGLGTKIYSDGRCSVKDATSNSRGGPVQPEGGQMLTITATMISFPIGDVPVGGFPTGCIAVVRSSRRFSFLVGNQYTIREPIEKTMAVKYAVLADKRKNVDP